MALEDILKKLSRMGSKRLSKYQKNGMLRSKRKKRRLIEN